MSLLNIFDLAPGRMIVDSELLDAFVIDYLDRRPSCPSVHMTGWRTGPRFVEFNDLLRSNFELVEE